MNTDSILIKTSTVKERNDKIVDIIFDLEEYKQDVINTFNKSDLDTDKKHIDPIFIDFKKLYLIENLDPEFLWNLYKYKSPMKTQHESMKYSYFLWSKKNEDTFIKLLQSELINNTKYPFLLIINSLIHQYNYTSYIEIINNNKDIIKNILEYYFDKKHFTIFTTKNEFKIPKTGTLLFSHNNIEYINKALNLYFLNFI